MRLGIDMPDGPPYVLRRLLSSANHRQREVPGYLSVGLTLTPRATGRAGRNLCPNATKGCSASCFSGNDRMAWRQNKRVVVARTRLFTSDPATLSAVLRQELHGLRASARRRGLMLVCRLNVVSDVPFEREMPKLFRELPDVQFMDYTKDVARVLNPDCPPNYHLTFSRSDKAF